MSGRRGVSSGLLALGLGLGLAGCSETTDEPAPLLDVDVDIEAPALCVVQGPDGATFLVAGSQPDRAAKGSSPLRLTDLPALWTGP